MADIRYMLTDRGMEVTEHIMHDFLASSKQERDCSHCACGDCIRANEADNATVGSS